VTFSGKGVQELSGHVKEATKGTGDFTTTASKAEKAAKSFGEQAKTAFSGIAGLAGKLSLGGGAGIGGILFGAGRGTVEMDQFTTSMERLVRAVGDKLAPYVRMATEGVTMMTEAWNGLGSEMQTIVTKWAVIGTAIAGVIALLPTIAGAIGAVLSTIGAMAAIITSPFVVTVAAIGAVIVAAGALYAYLSGGMSETAESMTDATGDWKDSVIGWTGLIAKTFAQMWNAILQGFTTAFNFISKKFASISDWIADLMASWGEWLGLFEKGTTDALRAMDPIKAITIDTKGLELDPDKAAEAAKSFGRGVKDSMNDALGAIDKAMGRITKAGASNEGFGRGQVAWEGIGDTWSRLQGAAAKDNPLSTIKEDTKQLREIVTVGVTCLSTLLMMWPPVTE
jgi:hypothetical protein